MVAYVSAQSCSAAQNSGTTISSWSATAGTATSDGNLICVFAAGISLTNGNPFSWTITDNASNTYNAEGKTSDANGMSYVWFYCGSSSGSPTQFTLNGGGDTFEFASILVDPFSGVNGGAGHGVGNGNSQFNPGTGTDAITCPAETTLTGGGLIWAVCMVDDNTSPNVTPGTGFTAAQSVPGFPVLYSEYAIGPTNTSAATFTDATEGATGNNYYSTGSLEFAAAASSIYLPRPMRTIYVPDYRIKRR